MAIMLKGFSILRWGETHTVFKNSHKVRCNSKSDRRCKSSRDLSVMSSRERDLVNSNKESTRVGFIRWISKFPKDKMKNSVCDGGKEIVEVHLNTKEILDCLPRHLTGD